MSIEEPRKNTLKAEGPTESEAAVLPTEKTDEAIPANSELLQQLDHSLSNNSAVLKLLEKLLTSRDRGMRCSALEQLLRTTAFSGDDVSEISKQSLNQLLDKPLNRSQADKLLQRLNSRDKQTRLAALVDLLRK